MSDQVALVTGASSGIGRAIALSLADHGAEVCLVARRQAELQAVADQARRKEARAHVCCADVTNEQDLRQLAERVDREFGRLDVLVLCGGAIAHDPMEQASLADLDLQYLSNLRAPYALTQFVLPLLRCVRGQVVFINSSTGLRAAPTAGQFSATQHALRAVADSLRDEVNVDGIRVLSVYPGRTATPRIAALFAKEGRLYQPELLLQPEDVAAIVSHALTLPRSAEITDVSIRPMRKTY